MDTSTFQLAAVPDAVSAACEYVIQMAGTVINVVTVNAVLSLGIGMWIVGGGIGLFKRLV